MTGEYVVVYDETDKQTDDETECYYGNFSTPEQAKSAYARLTGGDGIDGVRRTNARLALVVEELPSGA